jgi:hypothetical protein
MGWNPKPTKYFGLEPGDQNEVVIYHYWMIKKKAAQDVRPHTYSPPALALGSLPGVALSSTEVHNTIVDFYQMTKGEIIY